MVYMRELFSTSASEYITEDEKCTSSEHDATPCKGGMYTRLAVKHSAHVNRSATSDAAHVVKLRRSKRLRYLPFASELTNMRFSFFINSKGTEVTTACRFVESNIRCSAMLPVLDKGAEMLYPLFSTGFIRSLMITLAQYPNKHRTDTYL